MRKIYTLLMIGLLVQLNTVNGQVVFSEPFDFTGPLPADWQLADLDGNNVDPFFVGQGLFADPWEGVNFGGPGLAAYSTSNYDPAGQADDWMMSPQITVTLANSEISFEFWAFATDSIEVLIATAVSGPGGTPVTTDFTNSLFLGTAPVSQVWTALTLDISAFGPGPVWVAFRNVATDQNIVGVRNFIVRDVPGDDVAISTVALTGTPQQQIFFFQGDPGYATDGCGGSSSVGAVVEYRNNGLNTLDTVFISYWIDTTVNDPVVDTNVFFTEMVTGVVASGASATHIVTMPADFTVNTSFDFYVDVRSDADQDATNNTILFGPNVSTTPRPIPYATSYEVFDNNAGVFQNFKDDWPWIYIDGNIDGEIPRIGFDNTGTLTTSGDFFLLVEMGDDWAITPCLDLVGGQGYSVRYNHRTGTDGGTPPNPLTEVFELWLGTAPTPGGMTTMFERDTITFLTYQPYSAQFTAPATGTYHVGIHGIFGGFALGDFRIFIDDFSIDILQGPTANFSFSQAAGICDSSITFTDLSTNAPVSYSWDFGDGNSSTASNPTHQYASTGMFNVCLTVTNLAGMNTFCQMVNVTGVVAPTAALTLTDQGNFLVVADASASTPDCITQFDFDWGDGNTDIVTTDVFSHTYINAGTYNVCITTHNPQGMDQVCMPITLVMPGIDNIDPALDRAINIFPNPVTDVVNLSFDVKQSMDVRIQVTSAVGQLIYEDHRAVANGDQLSLDMSDHATGVYYVKVEGENGVSSKRFLLAR